MIVLAWFGQVLSPQEIQAQRREVSQQSYDPKAIEAGNRLFGESCSVCHAIDGRGGARGPDLTRGLVVNRGSDEEVAKVIRQGVPNSSMPPFALPADEIHQLVAFIRSLSTKAVQLSVPGDQDSGKLIFFGKGRCSACHMIRGQGGLLGPDLSNLGSERTLEEIRLSVISPSLREDARYRAVTVMTQKGEKITGTVRNRDNFSLQLMDAEGALHFFLSSELREVALEEKSAMPDNYEKLLGAAELQDLLAFLSRQTVAN
jgi:putative heme-binding domain-containing protein